ncbi:MAG: phosphoglycolate phosphatase [Rhodospirillales bacterium 20-60-12]|nr:MAG: phosphoglycolate phosphatase [Rhodospirillales bacterium 20-60-12]HQT66827.1 HAD-IA family hydrolase [Acetobacteraceae bacterium]
MASAVIFDLDGTLIDSEIDIRAALNRLFAKLGLAALSRADVMPMIGDGARKLVERAFAARGLEANEAHQTDFLEDYEAHAADDTRAFPGMEQALKTLVARGYHLAVCTNKPVAPARTILRDLGLDSYFTAITGGDSTAFRKPDPRHLQASLTALGVSADQAVMIGDHQNDMLAARGLGVSAIYAGWGYGLPEMAHGAPRLDDISALPALVGTILSPNPGHAAPEPAR